MELCLFQGAAGLGKPASKCTQVAAGRLLPHCVVLFQPAPVSSDRELVARREGGREGGNVQKLESIPGSCHNLPLSLFSLHQYYILLIYFWH